MVRDRMGDLKNIVENEGKSNRVLSFKKPDKCAGGGTKQCLYQIEEIRANLDTIATYVEDVKKAQSDILRNPVNDNKSNKELERLNEDIKSLTKDVRLKLKTVEQQIENDKKPASSTDQRIIKGQYRALSVRFVQVMTDYNKVQLEYKDKCKGRIQRKLDIIGKHVNDEQIEEMVENNNTAIFTEGIIIDSQQAKMTLADIEARHHDIIKLESDIHELHELFVDLAILVENQGDTVDHIEFNIENAVQYVTNADVDLKEAKKKKRKLRKTKIILAVTSLIIITVVIVIIVCVV